MYSNLFLLLLIKLLVILQFTQISAQNGLPPRAYADTGNGPLLGNVTLSRDGRQYFQFLGIPYGLIPERFGLSRPSLPWGNQPREALTFGPPCIQINEFTGEVSGEEDCLFLNVYTPELPFRNNSPSLPVIFAIHSGGFALGDAKNLGPSYMMDENVVVVTANFRLGPFGFLNSGIEAARGNMGLKDLILALKWVNKEIKHFGGDPERVVVEGSSSASFVASYLTISPMAKGLISGAISHSGSALCPWTKQFKKGMALSNAKKLAVAVDCPSNNPSYLVRCLQRLDPKVILEATFPADSVLFNVSYPQFGPSLETYANEGVAEDSDIFLNEDPIALLVRGDFNKIPYILGTTSNEGLLVNAAGVLSDEKLVERLNTEFGRVAPNTFIYEDYSKDPCTVSSEISRFYFAQKNITKEDPFTVKHLSLAYGDRWFHKCTRDMATLYSLYAPIYLYNFTRSGPHSLVDHFDWYSSEDKLKPPSHADELQYLFHNPNLFPEISLNSNISDTLDYNFSKRLVKMFTSFAENGRPDCSLCDGSTWLTASSSNESNQYFFEDESRRRLQWLQIDNNSHMEYEHPDFISRMDFWDNLGLSDYSYTEGRNLLPPLPLQSILPSTTSPSTTSPSTGVNYGYTTGSTSQNPTTGSLGTTMLTETTPPSNPTIVPDYPTSPPTTQSPPIQRSSSENNENGNTLKLQFNTTILLSVMFPQLNNSRVQNQSASFSNIPLTLVMSKA